MTTERRRIGSPSVFLVNGDYLHLCIYDCEHAVYKRSISQPDLTLDTDIIEALQEELHACNPHVRMFKGIDIYGENQDTHIVLCGPTGKSFGEFSRICCLTFTFQLLNGINIL